MHIVGRKQTTRGFNTKAKSSNRNKTKGYGMVKEFYENAQTMEDPTKNYSPGNVRKFDKIKIKGSKPKNYITF